MTSGYSAVVFATLSILLSAGCVSLPSPTFPNVPQYWEMVSSIGREADDCRDLSGSYSLTADANSYSDGSWGLRQMSEYAIYSSLIGPADAAGISRSRLENANWDITRTPNDKFFRIRFDDPTDLFVDYRVDKDKSIYSFHFSSTSNQFSCEIGIIRFPVKVDLSGGKGVQANSQKIRVLGANSNGDLTLYDQTSQTRKTINAQQPTFGIFKFTR